MYITATIRQKYYRQHNQVCKQLQIVITIDEDKRGRLERTGEEEDQVCLLTDAAFVYLLENGMNKNRWLLLQENLG